MAGREIFWGLSSEFDFDWLLTEKQKKLKQKLIDVSLNKIRPHAIHCDKTYEFPRKSLEHLADLGLLGLVVPKELGGLEENHLFVFMVVETIARYGCYSTALIFTMHLATTTFLAYGYMTTRSPLFKSLLMRINKEKLIGAVGGSDPATGSHVWSRISSKFKILDDDKVRILKYVSWMTSSGFADFYISMAVINPNDSSKFCSFLAFKDEVRCPASKWSALGAHGNHSGPLILDGVFPKERIITTGDNSDKFLQEVSFIIGLFGVCANGVSLASIDLAKRHVTTKSHADTGKRVCDYESIQDYFGEAVSTTNAARSHAFFYAISLDRVTNNFDWNMHKDPDLFPRSKWNIPMHETKLTSSLNVIDVTNKMMFACGGSGYKTDLGLERLFRDGRASWVMGPTAEVSRQIIGKIALMGVESLDLWEHSCNERTLNHELNKMTLDRKKELVRSLLEEVQREENQRVLAHPFQDTDFINPLNTEPPSYSGEAMVTEDGRHHRPALNPDTPARLKLLKKQDIGKDMALFNFQLPHEDDYTGCLPGQYIMIRARDPSGRIHERHISPVSRVDDFGKLEIVLKYEAGGFFSQAFQEMEIGEEIECLGPCGGFEYESNKLDELCLLVSGSGITAGLQIIRAALSDPSDKTNVSLTYFSNSFEEMIYREELILYERSCSRFRCLLTLGEATEDWEGEEGHIDTKMIEWSLQKRKEAKQKVVICGGATMIISCLHSLKSLRYPSDGIYIYGYIATSQLRNVYGNNIKLSGHKCC